MLFLVPSYSPSQIPLGSLSLRCSRSAENTENTENTEKAENTAVSSSYLISPECLDQSCCLGGLASVVVDAEGFGRASLQ